MSNYRIDRMENAATENDEITPVKEFENFNLSEYCKQTFSMFTGELFIVELEVDNGMIDEILDRFGKGVKRSPMHFVLNNLKQLRRFGAVCIVIFACSE